METITKGSFALRFLLAALILAAAGCAGSNPDSQISAGTEEPAAGLTSIPAPSQLAKSQSMSQVKLLGDGYGHDWPSQQVTTVEPGVLRFSPDSDYSAGTDGMAWAIYQPGVHDAAEYSIFHLLWNQPPEQFGDYWVGLADFNLDGWDWFRLTETSRFHVAPSPNLSGDSTFFVIACGGNSPGDLRQIGSSVAVVPDHAPPDFTLKLMGEERNITLSDYRGERPVVLILGSYT